MILMEQRHSPHTPQRLIMEIWFKASEFKEESKTCITGLVGRCSLYKNLENDIWKSPDNEGSVYMVPSTY